VDESKIIVITFFLNVAANAASEAFVPALLAVVSSMQRLNGLVLIYEMRRQSAQLKIWMYVVTVV
jgi:hypothetical protein